MAKKGGALPAFEELELIRREGTLPVRRFCARLGIPRSTWSYWRSGALHDRPVRRWPAPVVDPQVVNALVAARTRSAASPIAGLSARELEVLREMAAGKTNAAIGRTIALSESAVEKYASSIFSKLGLTEEADVHRRVAAVLAYLESSRQDTR